MMRVARAALSAFLSMALVVGMVPDCAYAKVAAQTLRLGASQEAQGTAGDAPGEARDGGAETPAPEGAPSGEPAPADTGEAGDVAAPGEVADGDVELQSAAPEEGFSYRQASGGVEVTGYAGDATELSIPEELGGSKVVGIANSALSGHASLRSVALPPSLGRVGTGAFRGCSSLASVDLPPSVSFVDNGAFEGCSSLSSVTLPEGLRGLGRSVFRGCPLAFVTVPASLESTEGWRWGDGPFAGSGLSSARLAEGSVRVATGLFGGCDRLASVEVPGTVTSVGDRAFQGCTSLPAALEVPASVATLGSFAYEGCSQLASVALPPSLGRVGTGAFRGCSSLASVDLPPSVSFVDNGAFEGCSSLSSVTLPEGLRGLGRSVFRGCPLAFVTVPASLESTEGWRWGDGPFAGSGLSSARLAEGSVRVATGLFGGCDRLASVEVPGTVTSVGDRAFQGCTSLASLSLPASVTSIADTAFEGCDALTISCPRGSFAYSWAMEHGMGVAASDGTHALLDPAACSYSARRLDDGLVELTVRWGLAEPSADVSVGAVTLGVPASTDVREVRVDGAAADWSLSGRKLYVPTGAPSGSVEVLCEVPAGEASSPSYASVALRSGGAPASEVVGSVADLGSPLSISVPEVTASGTFSVRGNAPAGSRVELRVGGEVVGGATASPSGSYAATVSVPTTGGRREYAITASCGNGADAATARGTVLYDPATAGVTSFVMRYDGRDHDLLGADSVTLTFLLSSYHGEHPFRFEVAFDAPPERIEAARVVSAKGTDKKHMDLAWDGSVGRWVAEGWFDPADHDYVPGALSVSYRAKPVELRLDLVSPSLIASLAYRPAAWDDITVTQERISEKTLVYTYHSPTFFDDSDGPATITVTRRDAEEARQAGAPATVEEAIAQGYEPAGPTNLPVAPGKVIGSPKTVGGPYKTENGGTWYVKKHEGGPDWAMNLSLVEFGGGSVLDTLIELNTSRVFGEHVTALGNSLKFCNNWIFKIGGSGVAIGVWAYQQGQYDKLKEQVANSGLSAREKEILYGRIEYARNFNTVFTVIGLVGTAIGIVDPPVGMAFSIIGLVGSFASGYVDASIFNIPPEYVFFGTLARFFIDPCGRVTDSATGEPIPGARVTLWCRPTPDADPEPWDASPYGQQNPLAADARGSFSWDVPEGWWQVRVEAEGYRPVSSKWVRVPSGEEPDLSLSLEPLSPSAWVGPHAASTSAPPPNPPVGLRRVA